MRPSQNSLRDWQRLGTAAESELIGKEGCFVFAWADKKRSVPVREKQFWVL
jgi:hypothetical protein